MKKTILHLLIITIVILSCKKEKNGNDIDRTYVLKGKKITSIYPVWPPTQGEHPVWDTLDITLTIRLELSQDKKDSVRFYGLEQANVVHDEGPNCGSVYYCGVYAAIHNDQLLFNLQSPGGKYDGVGRIYGDSLELDTKWNYRPSTFFYKVKGKKQ